MQKGAQDDAIPQPKKTFDIPDDDPRSQVEPPVKFLMLGEQYFMGQPSGNKYGVPHIEYGPVAAFQMSELDLPSCIDPFPEGGIKRDDNVIEGQIEGQTNGLLDAFQCVRRMSQYEEPLCQDADVSTYFKALAGGLKRYVFPDVTEGLFISRLNAKGNVPAAVPIS
ncbi:MAG: hypothetical protein MZV49_25675 [Rhodopseudomonas palustris]|nr:hypothetical protein [Rhodopseudomonas palustris]